MGHLLCTGSSQWGRGDTETQRLRPHAVDTSTPERRCLPASLKYEYVSEQASQPAQLSPSNLYTSNICCPWLFRSPLIPRLVLPCCTAMRAYSIWSSFPVLLKVVSEKLYAESPMALLFSQSPQQIREAQRFKQQCAAQQCGVGWWSAGAVQCCATECNSADRRER